MDKYFLFLQFTNFMIEIVMKEKFEQITKKLFKNSFFIKNMNIHIKR